MYFAACVDFNLNFAFLMTREQFSTTSTEGETEFLLLKSQVDDWWYSVTHQNTGLVIPNMDFFIGKSDNDDKLTHDELLRIYNEDRLYSTNPRYFIK